MSQIIHLKNIHFTRIYSDAIGDVDFPTEVLREQLTDEEKRAVVEILGGKYGDNEGGDYLFKGIYI